MPIDQRIAIHSLQNNKKIIIKPADKDSGIVIQDKQQYMLEAKRQLNDTQHYVQLPHSLQKKTQVQVQIILKELYNNKCVNFKQICHLMGPPTPRLRQFYLLLKIHTDP